MKKATVKKDYSSVDQMYSGMVDELIRYSKTQLTNKDNAMDAVNEAWEIVLKWKIKNPKGMINPKIMYAKVQRVCRRINRAERTGNISLDDPAYASYFRTI